MRAIVRDEQRCDGPKSARRCAVARGSSVDGVTSLAGATSPCCTPFLATELLRAITGGNLSRKDPKPVVFESRKRRRNRQGLHRLQSQRSPIAGSQWATAVL